MKEIIKILSTNSAQHISIENEPYMRLVIERIGTGPRNRPAISVCHYGEQNGDLMRDPEMCFEEMNDGTLSPYYFRNDYAGIEQEAFFKDEANQVMVRPRLVRELNAFARIWNRNLRNQGFTEAAAKSRPELTPS